MNDIIEETRAPSVQTAAIVSAPSAPIPGIPDAWTGPTGVLSVVLGLASTIFFLRKKYFNDNTDIAKSKAESGLIATLIQQAESYKKDAEEAWAQRTSDAEKIARQEAQIESMLGILAVMRSILKDVAPEKAAMFDTIHFPTQVEPIKKPPTPRKVKTP